MLKITMKNVQKKIGNRFDLILIAARRARQMQIENKENFFIKKQNDKYTVISLKEIEKDFDCQKNNVYF